MGETAVPIVDARSGQRVRVGDWVRYPNGGSDDDWKLVNVVRVGLFSAELAIGRQFSPIRDAGKLMVRRPGPPPPPGAALVVHKQRCPVRWFHPAGGGAWRVILVPT